MKRVLLGFAAAFAAAVASAAPAQAMDNDSPGFSNGRGDGPHFRRDFRRDCFEGRRGDRSDGRRGDRRHRRGGSCDSDVVLGVYGGEWALYNNRTWESDSYNDWWHDRPDRAFPRWMQHNDNCQRLWWSGGGWRC